MATAVTEDSHVTDETQDRASHSETEREAAKRPPAPETPPDESEADVQMYLQRAKPRRTVAEKLQLSGRQPKNKTQPGKGPKMLCKSSAPKEAERGVETQEAHTATWHHGNKCGTAAQRGTDNTSVGGEEEEGASAAECSA